MPEPGTAVEPGSFLGQFELLRFLGRGSFGEVYLAHDRSAGVRVCLKVLSRSASEKVRANLQREAEMLGKLGHAGVPRSWGSGEVAGRLYLAMAFREGETLRKALKRIGRLEPEQARKLFEGLLQIMHHCHSREVLHLDLKPENILVGEDFSPSLIDFGLAEAGGARPGRGKAGTPRYMAPEQLQGKPVSPATDLYQLALVFLECLLGRPVFRSRSGGERALEERQDSQDPGPGFPDTWRVILRRMTSPDPGRRFPSAEGVLQALGCSVEEGEHALALPAVRMRSLSVPEGESRVPREEAWEESVPTFPQIAMGLGFGGLLGLLLGPGLKLRFLAGILQFLTLLAPPNLRFRAQSVSWGFLLNWVIQGILGVNLGIWMLSAAPILLPLSATLVGGLWLMEKPPPERLLRREAWRPLLLEVLTPGLGYWSQGKSRASLAAGWMVGGFLLLSTTFLGGVLSFSLFLISCCAVFLGGLESARLVEREEARLLLGMGEESEEKVRCQAGMGMLTARLIALARRGEWSTPLVEKGSRPLEGKVLKALVAEIPEIAPCFHEQRVMIHFSRGANHLLCLRHNLCPSPLPEFCDREAGTGSGSFEGSVGGETLGGEASTRILESSVDPSGESGD